MPHCLIYIMHASLVFTDHESQIDVDKTVNLDSLLIQLRLQVTAKWHQFGVAVDIPDEILEQYSSYPADERLMEVLDYWLKNSGTPGPTWRDVAKVLSDIELHELAEGIMNVYETGVIMIRLHNMHVIEFLSIAKLAYQILRLLHYQFTGCLPIEVDVDDSDSDETILLPLQLPSRMRPLSCHG